MNDDVQDSLTFEETPAPPWYPSPKLRSRLLLGVWATFAVGAVSLASSLIDPDLNLFPGFSLADALMWAGLVPLFLVRTTYQGLADETRDQGLAKSALGLFLIIAFCCILSLATLNGLAQGWQITCWVVVGLGLFALAALPFISAEDQQNPEAATLKAEPTETADQKDGATVKASRVGIVGGVGVMLVVMLKVFAKGLFLKILLVGRLFRNLNLEAMEGLVGGGLLILGVVYVLWFATAKIRLRNKLGGIAVVVGWVEILWLLAAGALFIWLLATAIAVANQPGVNEKDIEALFRQKGRELLPLEIVGEIFWTALTMFLFLSVRSRTNSEDEWNRDLALAPTESE